MPAYRKGTLGAEAFPNATQFLEVTFSSSVQGGEGGSLGPASLTSCQRLCLWKPRVRPSPGRGSAADVASGLGHLGEDVRSLLRAHARRSLCAKLPRPHAGQRDWSPAGMSSAALWARGLEREQRGPLGRWLVTSLLSFSPGGTQAAPAALPYPDSSPARPGGATLGTHPLQGRTGPTQVTQRSGQGLCCPLSPLPPQPWPPGTEDRLRRGTTPADRQHQERRSRKDPRGTWRLCSSGGGRSRLATGLGLLLGFSSVGVPKLRRPSPLRTMWNVAGAASLSSFPRAVLSFGSFTF